MVFVPFCKLTGSVNVGKVLPMKLTSYSDVPVIKFVLFSSLFCKVLGGGGGGGGGGETKI